MGKTKTAGQVLAELGIKKKTRKKSGGDKKHGRNLAKCALYRREGRREKNKERKQRKHLKRLSKKK